MDISKRIDKELDEVKAALMETLRQKKTGGRIRQAATKTPDKANARATRRVPLMKESQNNPDTESARALRIQTHTVKKESQRGGATASRSTQFQTWAVSFKKKMMYTAMQKLSPKDRCNLITPEQLQIALNSKEFK